MSNSLSIKTVNRNAGSCSFIMSFSHGTGTAWFSFNHACTSRWPFSDAFDIHCTQSQGHPFARAHCSTPSCPHFATYEHVCSSHGQPFARAHCSTSRCPPKAAACTSTFPTCSRSRAPTAVLRAARTTPQACTPSTCPDDLSGACVEPLLLLLARDHENEPPHLRRHRVAHRAAHRWEPCEIDGVSVRSEDVSDHDVLRKAGEGLLRVSIALALSLARASFHTAHCVGGHRGRVRSVVGVVRGARELWREVRLPCSRTVRKKGKSTGFGYLGKCEDESSKLITHHPQSHSKVYLDKVLPSITYYTKYHLQHTPPRVRSTPRPTPRNPNPGSTVTASPRIRRRRRFRFRRRRRLIRRNIKRRSRRAA